MTSPAPTARTAEAPPKLIDDVAFGVGNYTYSDRSELGKEITHVLNQHNAPRQYSREIRDGIVSHWEALRAEYPEEGTWSP